tara:strand:+ start:611 stop:1045 length:435 start_codon:yes stop_codon:yes gene_type:complete
MKITLEKLKEIIKEELTKEMLGELDLPDRGFDAEQWDYQRMMLDSKIKSVLKAKESQVLDIDDKKIMRILRGLHSVIGPNPNIKEELDDDVIMIPGYGRLKREQVKRKLAEMLKEAAEDALEGKYPHLDGGVIQALHAALKEQK